ncbi:GDSL-type esterase/lipase family protein [Chitinophaga solisilvae]|uniref:SGNH hydrolase-type esterase domain-containing protein n=1 Tax=Chitinophaga solisilvae TaxID=1233460 RepID=A0A433WJ11_9BACT|nr:GDSL-type esterase/lipase family protein [Chitinophaga solisilvae]NSL89923.1 hypothetical protein [Chitinophaga solisilvae]
MITDRLKTISKCMMAAASLLLVSFTAHAQQDAAGDIQQDTALYRVFNQLYHADSNVISILHLGDSHIQAGHFSLTTGALLQQRFGNAGRGFVFPYSTAGTNGPDDARWSSTSRWSSERIIDRYKPPVLGPGAIAISTTANEPTISFSLKENPETDNSFSKAQLLYDAGIENSAVYCPSASVTVTPAPFSGSPTIGMATLDFPQPQQSFQVTWGERGSSPFRFYGAVLQNGHKGVLYHSVGINGAMYLHYNDLNNTVMAGLSALKPSLIIISLGTNEAYSRFDPLQFRNEIDRMVQLIRSQRPEAAILLTTPPDCMRAVRKAVRKKVSKRKYKTFYTTAYYPNPYIAMVTQQITGYARQHGIACWNFNAVNKAQSDRFAGGWASDHIHFSVKGYQLQGQLLYEALQKSYAQYLQVKKNSVNTDDRL